MASTGAGQQVVKAVAELAQRLRPSFVNGKWRGAAISAKNRARLRRETLLSGEEWPYDAPRKEMKTKIKGHKHDKEAAVSKRIGGFNISGYTRTSQHSMSSQDRRIRIMHPDQIAADMDFLPGITIAAASGGL
ncbi:unnamed protein product [Closterium sp. NIES-64]|nr:unnamed protein product [Closterium sp. NIES-64]